MSGLDSSSGIDSEEERIISAQHNYSDTSASGSSLGLSGEEERTTGHREKGQHHKDYDKVADLSGFDLVEEAEPPGWGHLNLNQIA